MEDLDLKNGELVVVKVRFVDHGYSSKTVLI